MPTGTAVRASGERLKRSEDIRRVFASGRRLTGARMQLYVAPGSGGTRVGFACPRSVGGAVIRNRARRAMREAWRGLARRVQDGYDVMALARPEIRGARVPEVARDLERLLVDAGVVP